MAKAWFLYLIECADGSLYTGIAIDVEKRYALHAAGKGARYTRSHPPKRLAAIIGYADRAAASRAEYQVKQLTTAGKRDLCRRHPAIPECALPDRPGGTGPLALAVKSGAPRAAKGTSAGKPAALGLAAARADGLPRRLRGA